MDPQCYYLFCFVFVVLSVMSSPAPRPLLTGRKRIEAANRVDHFKNGQIETVEKLHPSGRFHATVPLRQNRSSQVGHLSSQQRQSIDLFSPSPSATSNVSKHSKFQYLRSASREEKVPSSGKRVLKDNPAYKTHIQNMGCGTEIEQQKRGRSGSVEHGWRSVRNPILCSEEKVEIGTMRKSFPTQGNSTVGQLMWLQNKASERGNQKRAWTPVPTTNVGKLFHGLLQPTHWICSKKMQADPFVAPALAPRSQTPTLRHPFSNPLTSNIFSSEAKGICLHDYKFSSMMMPHKSSLRASTPPPRPTPQPAIESVLRSTGRKVFQPTVESPWHDVYSNKSGKKILPPPTPVADNIEVRNSVSRSGRKLFDRPQRRSSDIFIPE